GAKVTREERGEVIRRLPALLKTLREGMALAGFSAPRQDERVAELNNALAAAFTAKAAAIPTDRLDALKERLESLEEMLPDTAHLQIDESLVLDLSGHESAGLEVVTSGGSTPTAAMLAWARELQVGSWFMLDYRDRQEAVQLAWRGLRGQLSLFVAPSGRCVLFQRQPLAAFLQAGLLQPAQDEALTVRATRSALAKLDVDPFRLLN
ncbi:MAG: DUF1631 family protein, partial [Rubrivivax sp.]|nr:DUF1631 family protein [Rubrivivax sp.]